MGDEVTYTFLRWHGRAFSSHNPGNKRCLHITFVLQVFLTELFGEDLFFGLYLDPDGEDADNKGDKSKELANRDNGPDKRDKDTGIHRVPHDPVRARPDDMVADLDLDHAAPVFAEVMPGPGGEPEPGDGENDTGDP